MTTRRAARTVLLSLASLALVTAAGCSAPVASAPPTAPPTWSEFAPAAEPTTPPAPAGPALNDRGNMAVALGETMSLVDVSDGAALVDLSVNKISKIKCDNQFASPPPPGKQFVRLDVVLNTHADPAKQLDNVMITQSWEFIAADGTSIDAGQEMACTYDSVDLKPNRKYTAKVYLSIPATADGAHLVWNPIPVDYGFEWPVTLTK